MFYLPSDTTLASCGHASFENTLAIWDMHFCLNHKFHFCTEYMWQLLPSILTGTPLMFCLPNDTTLASCELASFEITLAIWDIYFYPKSQIPLLYRINVTTSALNIKRYSAYVLPSKRHHPRLMWLAIFENTLPIWDLYFCPKITNSTFVQDKCDNFCR